MPSQKSPVDHGYAWVVLGSCFLMRLFVDGFLSCLGILMLQWQKYLQISASSAAWIGSTYCMLVFISAPISSALASHLTYRVLVTGAGIAAFICIFVLSLANQLWHLWVIVPILGLTIALIYQPACSFFIYYFSKRYVFATGLISAGSGIGYMIFPPLFEILITFFGFRGALQIISAIMANICVCGLLLRPSNNEKSRLDKEDKLINNSKRNQQNFCNEIAIYFDLSLFTNVHFVFEAVVNGLLFGSVFGAQVYFIPYSNSIGISDIKSSTLMSTLGLCGVLARLIPLGHLVDKKLISAPNLTGISLLLVGINTMLFPFLDTYITLVVNVALYGLAWGIGGTYILTVAAFTSGCKEKAPGAQAWFLESQGVGNLIFIAGIGFLHDKTNNYMLPFLLCGFFVLCIGFVVLADPLFKRWQESREKRTLKTSMCNSAYMYGYVRPSQV